ncbi:uncharacterized protein [Solanum lycopersicum]|uniref:uncharacterized protein n=1 Tax=Solanum lycopersicum TaxID=4081 RepID=UPI00374A9725
MGSVSHIDDEKKELVKKVHQLSRLGVRLVNPPSGSVLVHSSSESSFVVDVKVKQQLDPVLMELKDSVLSKLNESVSRGGWRAKFTSHFWRSFQKILVTKVNLSTPFHPKMDGQVERTFHTLEDMVRACAIDFKGSWDDHLPLIEFSYNNSYRSSIAISPFEALYGMRCRSLVGSYEVRDSSILGPEIIHDVVEKVR